MLLEIPDAAFTESPLTASELRLEIALYLYSKKRLSFGQARKIAVGSPGTELEFAL